MADEEQRTAGQFITSTRLVMSRIKVKTRLHLAIVLKGEAYRFCLPYENKIKVEFGLKIVVLKL